MVPVFFFFFCESMSLINVSLWADGSGQSSVTQKMIQGISHNCNKQMFRRVVTSNDLLKPAPLDASFPGCGCHLELATAERAEGPSRPACHLYGDRGSGSRPQPVPTFHIHSSSPRHAAPVGWRPRMMPHVKPSRLNRHDQLARPSPFKGF